MSFPLEIMARTIYGEARGEQMVGQIAVAHVILNRVKKGGWWGKSIAEVCLKPDQFSCWLPEDPNYRVLLALDESSEMFRQCLGVAYCVSARAFSDETKNSTHYCHKDLDPAWAQGIEPAIIIGNHKFFNQVR